VEVHRPGTSRGIDRYVRSRWYAGDLAAAQAVWRHPGIVEAAGSFVLLTYFASPGLLAVRAPDVGGSLRTAVDGHRERSFLEGIVGFGVDDSTRGGIGNPAVRRRVERLRDRHLEYPGMTEAYMSLVAGLLAIAPLRLHAHYGELVTAAVAARYWHYIRRVMRMLAPDLGGPGSTARRCGRLVEAGAGPSAAGRELILEFSQRHPEHVARAVPILFPAARQVVQQALAVLGESAWR